MAIYERQATDPKSRRPDKGRNHPWFRHNQGGHTARTELDDARDTSKAKARQAGFVSSQFHKHGVAHERCREHSAVKTVINSCRPARNRRLFFAQKSVVDKYQQPSDRESHTMTSINTNRNARRLVDALRRQMADFAHGEEQLNKHHDLARQLSSYKFFSYPIELRMDSTAVMTIALSPNSSSA